MAPVFTYAFSSLTAVGGFFLGLSNVSSAAPLSPRGNPQGAASSQGCVAGVIRTALCGDCVAWKERVPVHGIYDETLRKR